MTKNQLLKIKKLPMNTIKLIEELTEKFDLLGSAAFKNSTSVVTQSTDLVESGAVYDAIGWENKNYFTTEGITTAYYLNQNGTMTSSTNWRITDYIDISDLSNIELKGIGANGNTPSLCFYGSNKDYISGIQYRNRTDIITIKPSNAVYIRVSVFVDDMETIILTHASVDATKADNSVIGTVEDGTNPTKSYAVGEHMTRGGKFCTVTSPVTTSSTWVEGSNYTSGDVASEFEKYIHGTTLTITNLDNLPLGMGFANFSGNASPTSGYDFLSSFICFGTAFDRIVMIYRIGNKSMYFNQYNAGAWSGWVVFTGTPI